MGAEGIYVYLEKTDGGLEKRDGFSAPWAVRGKTAGVQGTAARCLNNQASDVDRPPHL